MRFGGASIGWGPPVKSLKPTIPPPQRPGGLRRLITDGHAPYPVLRLEASPTHRSGKCAHGRSGRCDLETDVLRARGEEPHRRRVMTTHSANTQVQWTRLGRTGMNVSRIAFGTWQLGGDWGATDEQAAIGAIRHAYDLGINFFDTAQGYGFGASEQLLAHCSLPTASSIAISRRRCCPTRCRTTSGCSCTGRWHMVCSAAISAPTRDS